MNMKQDIYWVARTRPLYITTLAFISALAVVGRWLLTPLPNVQPITVIFILMAVIFGPISSSIVVFVTIIVSSFIHGFGYWVVHQLLAYWIVIWICHIVLRANWHWVIQTFFVGVTGYLYGLLMTLLYALTVQLQNPLGYYIAGLYFDTLHAAGNIGFYLILSPVLTPLLLRMRRNLMRL